MNALIHPQPDPRIPLSILMLGVAHGTRRQPVVSRAIPREDSIAEQEVDRAYEEPERWDGMS